MPVSLGFSLYVVQAGLACPLTGRPAPTAFNRAGEKLRAAGGQLPRVCREVCSSTLRRARCPPPRGGRSGAPGGHRMTVYLADVQGWGYRQICDLTGMPAGTVKSSLHRGRTRLRAPAAGHASGKQPGGLRVLRIRGPGLLCGREVARGPHLPDGDGLVVRLARGSRKPPVQYFVGILRAGRRAGGGAARHHPEQRPAIPDRLEHHAVPGIVGVPGLDPGGAGIRAGQLVGVVPPVLGCPGPVGRWENRRSATARKAGYRIAARPGVSRSDGLE